jgi:hypothetical protein
VLLGGAEQGGDGVAAGGGFALDVFEHAVGPPSQVRAGLDGCDVGLDGRPDRTLTPGSTSCAQSAGSCSGS